ncbi:MAG TPA: FAD-dependent monooxygenase [Stenotrophobium sp.]|jgi:2-polyprenyl-6-methoxyphenol hydroxylase-like FAD-dependent oxidoreductase|nr:FAD-dependent monooxygenase [Stenotrophobium sp.]
MRNRDILIVGAGIAGPTLACWLARYGFRPTLLERAAAPRTGGYMLDFWGTGFTVAERMGLLPALRESSYRIRSVQYVDAAARRVGGFEWRAFEKALGERFFSILRYDLAQQLYRAAVQDAEVIHGDSISTLEQDADGVLAGLRSGSQRRFDLVIGADGLHSDVRRLVFGPHAQYEHALGYRVAAFTADGYARRDEGIYLCHNTPGRMLARYTLRGNRSGFLLAYADPGSQAGAEPSEATVRESVAALYSGDGWESAQALGAMRESRDFYCDSVSQTLVPEWAKGRVALLGDACFCPSLLAGEGSSMAMAGAYILAGELRRADGEHTTAFAAYQRRFKPFADGKQRATRSIGSFMVPRSASGLWLRNHATALMSIPWLADWTVGRLVADRLELPDYERPGA